jgi:hypothetical protein
MTLNEKLKKPFLKCRKKLKKIPCPLFQEKMRGEVAHRAATDCEHHLRRRLMQGDGEVQ